MKKLRCTLSAIFLVVAPTLALAETYPDRPVRFIVPFAPGGGASDMLGRIMAQNLSSRFGKQFFVENIPGGGTNIAMGTVAKAKPDGHTLLVGVSTLMVNPMIHTRVPYDPVQDFAPITLLGVFHFLLVVHPSVPARDARELIALIKASPGKYNYASSGIGTTPHLLGELLKLSFNLDLVHVPFNGGPPALNSVLGGSTPILFSPTSTAVPLVEKGLLRALAITSKDRLAKLPAVPTLAEAGLPGEDADTMVGILAPAGTPREIIDVLHGEIIKITAMPDVRERLDALGFKFVGNTPEEFGEYIKAEIARWGKVIRDANIRSE